MMEQGRVLEGVLDGWNGEKELCTYSLFSSMLGGGEIKRRG